KNRHQQEQVRSCDNNGRTGHGWHPGTVGGQARRNRRALQSPSRKGIGSAGDDHNIVTLKGGAQKAIDVGELAKADALLAAVETEQRRALDRLAVNAAETSARRGEISLARLRYIEAAKHFANAAGVFPPNSAHEDKRISCISRNSI